MIDFKNLSKTYRSEKASLHDITLSIKEGEFVTLVGHSGAGKTTLTKLLLVEETPTSGSIFFDGVDIFSLHQRDIPRYRQRIGVVFQDYKLLKNKTVYENISFAMEMVGKDDESISKDVPNALELVGLGDKEDSFPDELSGGEQQRLAIARAIINQPDVLIADEPTDSLDPENVQAVVQILKKINELGTTVILATHNVDVVKQLDDRIVILEHGRILKDTLKNKK